MFEDFEKHVREVEAVTHESELTEKKIKAFAAEFARAVRGLRKEVKIFSDYDADGITSAYIVSRIINRMRSDVKVDVEINDRRNAYGLEGEPKKGNELNIVLDMGSNQLDVILKKLGENSLMIDHHLIEKEEDLEKIKESDKLLNLHLVKEEDSAQYCTAGLGLRLLEELEEMGELRSEKGREDDYMRFHNGIAVMSAVGTVADVVNLLDKNSYNRRIVKEGIKLIDEGSEITIDERVAFLLWKANISEHTSAEEIGFKVGPLLNAPSRMCEIHHFNGGQKLWDAFNKEDADEFIHEMDFMLRVAENRKTFDQTIKSSEMMKDLINDALMNRSDEDAQIFLLDDENQVIPKQHAGIFAGYLAECLDKAVVVFVKTKDAEGRESLSGSGRNGKNNAFSLKEFMDKAVERAGVKMKYGGHTNAIGVSELAEEDFPVLEKTVREMSRDLPRKEMQYETATARELEDPSLLDRLKSLEPFGEGARLPEVRLKGRVAYRKQISTKKEWQRLRFEFDEENRSVEITDWNYNENKKEQDGYMFCNVKISNFMGEHIELETSYHRKDDEGKAREASSPKKTGKGIP